MNKYRIYKNNYNIPIPIGKKFSWNNTKDYYKIVNYFKFTMPLWIYKPDELRIISNIIGNYNHIVSFEWDDIKLRLNTYTKISDPRYHEMIAIVYGCNTDIAFTLYANDIQKNVVFE